MRQEGVDRSAMIRSEKRVGREPNDPKPFPVLQSLYGSESRLLSPPSSEIKKSPFSAKKHSI